MIIVVICRYDYYVETDDIDKELSFVLRKFGFKTPPSEVKKTIFINSHSDTKNKRKKAAVDSVQASTYAKMLERFQDDFEVFGYPIPSFDDFKRQYGEE